MRTRRCPDARALLRRQPTTSTRHPPGNGRIALAHRGTIGLHATVCASCRETQKGRGAHPELLHAIINTAFVLVDVGPCVAGGALRRDVPRRGLRDAVQPREKHPAVSRPVTKPGGLQKQKRLWSHFSSSMYVRRGASGGEGTRGQQHCGVPQAAHVGGFCAAGTCSWKGAAGAAFDVWPHCGRVRNLHSLHCSLGG